MRKTSATVLGRVWSKAVYLVTLEGIEVVSRAALPACKRLLERDLALQGCAFCSGEILHPLHLSELKVQILKIHPAFVKFSTLVFQSSTHLSLAELKTKRSSIDLGCRFALLVERGETSPQVEASITGGFFQPIIDLLVKKVRVDPLNTLQ